MTDVAIAVNSQLVRMGVAEPMDTTQGRENVLGSGLRWNGAVIAQCPVVLSVGSLELKLPIDPVMSVGGHNVIVRRNVAKGGTMRGTIKEAWREDDLKVTIAGVLRSDDRKTVAEYVGDLLQICQGCQTVTVDCDYLRDCFGITRLVVEDYDFPSTKGLDSQSYQLKCYTDDSYELLEKL